MTARSYASISSNLRVAPAFVAGAKHFVQSAVERANSTLRAMQLARMRSVLSSMSDYQLSQIGIERCDIPEYAESLMAHDREQRAHS